MNTPYMLEVYKQLLNNKKISTTKPIEISKKEKIKPVIMATSIPIDIPIKQKKGYIYMRKCSGCYNVSVKSNELLCYWCASSQGLLLNREEQEQEILPDTLSLGPEEH